MDYRFQPQLGMFYEESLQEASRRNSFTDAACLVTRTLQVGLNFYEREAIDTGIVGLLNGIGLTSFGFSLATAAAGVASVAPPAAPAAARVAAVGIGLMAVGIDNTLIYFLHIVTGGNLFHSRKEMEKFENILSFPGGGATTLLNTYLGLVFNQSPIKYLGIIPTRSDIKLIRYSLDYARESLDCSGPLPERDRYLVGDQGDSALGRYDGVLAGDLQKELNKLAEAARTMLQELNQKKREQPAAPRGPLPQKTPESPAPNIPNHLTDKGRSDLGEPYFYKGDFPNRTNPKDPGEKMYA